MKYLIFSILLAFTLSCNTEEVDTMNNQNNDTKELEKQNDNGSVISKNKYTIYEFPQDGKGSIFISPLPGKVDLEADIETLLSNDITYIISLTSSAEIEKKGISNFYESFADKNITVYASPIVDFGLPSTSQMDSIVNQLDSITSAGNNVLVHCMGGYGRSGTVMGCYANRILKVDNPIEYVRDVRGKDAIETEVQEQFVKNYK